MRHFTVLHKIFSNGSFFLKGVRRSLVRVFSVLLLGFIPGITFQAQTNIINVGANNTSENITIPLNGHTNITDYTITGTTSVKTITIQSGYEGTITLEDVSITSSRTGLTSGATRGTSTDASCITVLGENDRSNLSPVTKVKFILKGNNTLIYTEHHYCAIQVNQGAQIHIGAIDPNDNDSGILIAQCTAAASSSGGGGAGIGAPNFANSSAGQGKSVIYNSSGGIISSSASTAGGNIIISSGTITAKGGHAAGIGGGWYTYYNGIIVVYGGVIDVSVGRHAAGIGSGCPTGNGVINNYAENSAIISLPPTVITGYGKILETSLPDPSLALAGAKNITYMNDPNKPHITIRTVDNEPGANIYLDLTETPGLEDIFTQLGINYDLKKVKVGKTNSSGTDLEKELHGRFEQATTFFTDASSSKPATMGRPYMPVKKTVLAAETIVLPLLGTDIAFTDYPSTPLEVGYTAVQARENAHTIKMEYNDSEPMENVTYAIQGGLDFSSIIFLASDRLTEISPPPILNTGDIYYIVLPIDIGKPIGIYSDVLLISGDWKTVPLPGYIRRISEQRVVFNDTGTNNHIKVTASPNKFVTIHPATETVELVLNINHTGTDILYDPSDVTAKYLITTESDYGVALAANPFSTWSDLNIPAANGQNQVTTVSFNSKPKSSYYIHWYVESGVVYAHSQNVTNPPHLYGGFGPYILTEAVKAGSLTGNPSVCKDQIPSEIKGEVSTGGSGDFSYQWQISTNGTSWSDVGGNTQNYTPAPLTVSPTYFRRLTIDNQYGGTTSSDNVFIISIVADGLTFYWKQNTANNNWNDPANWVDASGMALNMVPVSCSNVYIPGGADNYPSLFSDDTPTDVYGSSVCRNITFAYGAELAFQHKLQYEKAYVQYNWGYYDDFSGVNYGDQPVNNVGGPSAPVKKRDRWYALAAPLKSMATGDFAFAGYPLAWQGGFSLSHPSTGTSGGELETGDFSKQFSTNDVPLSQTNNAIAVMVASYRDYTGCGNHQNLEGLRGIVEIPYFENTAKAAYYPGHIYDRFTEEGKFFYFNTQTLQLLHSPVGSMKRGQEAYRFVYEQDGGSTPVITVGGIPATVPGYKQSVQRQNISSLKVMIGNPFMASINAKRFFEVNSTKLNESAGYQLFNSTSQSWQQYSFTGAGNISPLQAFVVTLNSGEEDLLFPLEGAYALTGSVFRGSPLTLPEGSSLYLKSANSSGLEGDYTILGVTGTGESGINVRKLLYPPGHATPETFFIAPGSKDYNLAQSYESGMGEIGIGIKSSDTKSELSLRFENVDKFYAANNLRPVLIDKYTGISQDLLLNNTYTFNQRSTATENNYIDAGRFSLQLFSTEDTLLEKENQGITVVYRNNQLEVRSVREIEQVQVYDMFGRQLSSQANIKAVYYTRFLSLNSGVYIVKVHGEKGEIEIEKIVAM